MFHAWCSITVNSNVLEARIKLHKTWDFCLNVVSFCLYSTRFTRFGVGLGNTVNCDTLAPQRKHGKTLWFDADYHLFCILDTFFTCFCVYFSTVKRVNFDDAEKQVNYSDKLRRTIAPRNPSTTELHFTYLVCTFHPACMTFVDEKRQR